MRRWICKAWLLLAFPWVITLPGWWEIHRAWGNMHIIKRTREELSGWWSWWRAQ